MNHKYLALFILLYILCAGCKPETCPQNCGGFISIAAVGFTKAELNAACESVYPKNSSFSGITGSFCYSPADSGAWEYPSANDTTGDTLILLQTYSPQLSNGIANDYEFSIPAANADFKISAINLGGALVDDYSCYEGGKLSGGNNCIPAAYLISYTINGTNVTVPTNPPANTYGATGIIYLVK